jgi:Tfp pilus assembly protein PilX
MNPVHFIRPARRSGVALIIVLAMLVLLSGLLIAFLNTVTTERNSTNLSANTASARALADSTTNLVIGQIREATTRYTNEASWASQPGAIRTFSGTEQARRPSDKGSFVNDYNPGQYDFVYKLYSSENMKVRAADYEPSGGELKNEITAIQQFSQSVAQPGGAIPRMAMWT